jgi:hypothetical protein
MAARKRATEVGKTISSQFNMIDAEMNERLPSGQSSIFDNRIGWARTYLKKAGLIEPKSNVRLPIRFRPVAGWHRATERFSLRPIIRDRGDARMGSTGRAIAVQTTAGVRPRKLTKVIGYGAGGFAVLTPYHQARSGFVGKIPVDYNKIGSFTIPKHDFIGFTAEDRVKLSYHPDGFVQFSGEVQGKVISGRDPSTGEPKGVGLLTQPLSNPILSGPSFGMTAWGAGRFRRMP